MAMLDQSGSDYTYYKRIYDHCIAHVERAGTVAPMSLQGFKTHARNCGVDKYGWAIVDVTAASRVLQLCMQTAAQGGKGPATFESIVSIGSGVAYVEFMFHQAAQQLGCGTQVHCYDILPHCYQVCRGERPMPPPNQCNVCARTRCVCVCVCVCLCVCVCVCACACACACAPGDRWERD